MRGVNGLIAHAGRVHEAPKTDGRPRCNFCGKVYGSTTQARMCKATLACRLMNFPGPERHREWSLRAGTASIVYMLGEVFKHELQDDETKERGAALQVHVGEVWDNIKERHPVGQRVAEAAYLEIEAIARQRWGLGKGQRVGIVHLIEVGLLLVDDVKRYLDGKPESAAWVAIEGILEETLDAADPDGEGCPDSENTDDIYEQLRLCIWREKAKPERVPSLYVVNGGRFYVAACGRQEARAHIRKHTGLVRCKLAGVAPGAKLPVPVEGAQTALELLADTGAGPTLIILE